MWHGHGDAAVWPAEFGWGDELIPVMQSRGHPGGSSPFLGQLDHDELAETGSVDCVEQVQATGLEDPGRLADDGMEVGHVLEYVHAVDGIRAGVAGGQVLPGADPVVNGQAAGGGMRLRGGDRGGRGINADHRGAEPGDLLGHQAPAAADVNHDLPGRIHAPGTAARRRSRNRAGHHEGSSHDRARCQRL
jgi:hypothetical protein